MDFASAPLEGLLIQQTSADQLESFLKQLDQQFHEAADEKNRLGTLQILLPILYAHLEQLDNRAEEEQCLEAVITPLIKTCFARKSLVATESVGLVTGATGRLITRSVLDARHDHPHPTPFGYSCLLELLCQLVLVMETEPDLVGQEPTKFIEKHLRGNPAWTVVQEHTQTLLLKLKTSQGASPVSVEIEADDEDDDNSSFTQDNASLVSTSTFNATMLSSEQGILDVDCCVQALGQFVQCMNDSNKTITDKELQENLSQWMQVITAVSVSMLASIDPKIRSKLTTSLLPSLFGWHRKEEEAHPEQARDSQWCEMIWVRTLEIFTLPATNLLRSESYGLIAKFFDYYFGLNEEDRPLKKSASVHVRLDLRFKDDLFLIIQSGLRSNDSLARKYSSYILKRVIDFTDTYPNTLPSSPAWTPYFTWSTDKARAHVEMWNDWFLLYETVHEASVHVVEPVLPRIETLLMDTSLDPQWWILLLERAFQNETVSVKKTVLEYIFALENPRTLRLLGSQHNFFFDTLLKSLDQRGLFYVQAQGTLVSPFGEHLKRFVLNLIETFEEEARVKFMRQLIRYITRVLGNDALIFYVMEALASCGVNTPAWGPEELKSIRYLVDRHKSFFTVKSKRYLRKLVVGSLSKMTNLSALSFSDIAKTITSITTDYHIVHSLDEYTLIQDWLHRHALISESTDGVYNTLKERTTAYICGSMSDDIPIVLLRNQAKVLVKLSVLLVTDEGNINATRWNEWLKPLTERLNGQPTQTASFNRALVLLDEVSEEFSAFGDENRDVVTMMGLSESHILDLLNIIDGQYFESNQNEIIDEDSVDLFLSITHRILMHCKALKAETRESLIHTYFHKCHQRLEITSFELPPVASRELKRPGYLGLLRITYDAAAHIQYQGLPVDQHYISTLCSYQIRRTPEAEQRKPWGKWLTLFIQIKWECLESVIRYASMLQTLTGDSAPVSMFDVSYLFDKAIDQLECASEVCGEAILSSVNALFSFQRQWPVEEIAECVKHAVVLLKENSAQGPAFQRMSKLLINMILRPELLKQKDLNEDGGPIKTVFQNILEFGNIKPLLVGDTVSLFHSFWSMHTEASNYSMLQYSDVILNLLLYGPSRDQILEKHEAFLAMRLLPIDVTAETEGTVENMFSQNDYTVRVMMNDILLRLDESCEQHRILANRLLKGLLALAKSGLTDSGLDRFTVKHLANFRIGCSLILLARFVTEDHVDETLNDLIEITKKETWITGRCYIEWFIVRLLCKFPRKLAMLYTELKNAGAKTYGIVSLIAITLSLGENLSEESARDYFEQIFPILLSWFVVNKYMPRLYSYCSWKRNWKSCKERGLDSQLKDNAYMLTMNDFMDRHSDCRKCDDKISREYMMTTYDPFEDYNIEFIFRELPTLLDVVDSERIGSRAFMRINPEPASHCPFTNPSRSKTYKSANPAELFDEEETDPQREAKVETMFQKKITPWEMMMQTDVDLTKALVQQKRRRNDLIVVASLVTRLPNLAGLCRTCEIFNASQLAVHSIKIKSNPEFSNVSVSAEKWMPMIEVAEADVAKFLMAKKTEGYTICGLEQTTTSVPLGEYAFPEKCVLLLGKESAGTPPELLHILDQAIEIPQYGIIRSLNVHVSAAICVYEYTKQMQWHQSA